MNPLPAVDFLIMGVVNVTPDSFSDGGRYLDADKACEHALQLVAEGADIIDLGGESTRPGAPAVDVEDEWRRLAPVIERLTSLLPRAGVGLSVDTQKPALMLRAAAAGAGWINDVSGTADAATLRTLAAVPGLAYMAMHRHGSIATMQQCPLPAEPAVAAVAEFFERAHARLIASGFSHERIYLDPGIGFGKSDRANLMLMAATPTWARTYQLAIGVSRKSWLGRLLQLDEPSLRDSPSKIAELALAMAGARVIRTHDVARLAHLRQVCNKAET